MKLVILALAAFFFSLAASHKGAPMVSMHSGNNIARCIGSTPCHACSNCSACKWCGAGGTCGVCAPAKKTSPRTYKPPSYSGRCKAITKRGTRCSRSARSNGYCWQHGG